MTAVYKRILLKVSGEALAGSKGTGLDNETLKVIGQTIRKLVEMNVQVAVVVGGGNFWRGRSSEGMDRVTADHMGMLATTMNALALSDALEQAGAVTRVLSAIEMRQIAETYIRKRAIRHLEKGRVVIFACGTGNPFFSTDTAAALRASEIEADIIFKATMVDGVYNKDPKKHADAVKYSRVSHDEVLQLSLGVMDATAAALCRDNKVAIAVFDMSDPENIIRMAEGEELGTIVI
ncbi:MAG: uridylate kinase [Clostridiales bacterium]|jgi:uridylate kinase|nr:UMP kinase [Eubacteriales bacterium]MDD3197211.1 UMP kinase [Eubacteriales bacterium]MDD3502558.1 UMP kinase [Eubacteriales bacterium]MDD4681680.1 UMP kinase [Eubacteriales bacterium]MDN5313886.1 uridylate kinase [Clostridiales bacterium]